MVTRQELEVQLSSWDGLNKYLFKAAKKRLQQKDYEGAKVVKKVEPVIPKVDKVAELKKNKTVFELKNEAKALGIKGYWKMNEDALVKAILAKKK